MYFTWVLFQALLYNIVPGKIVYGSFTQSGQKLKYKINGLMSWLITISVFLMISVKLEIMNTSIVCDNWFSILCAAGSFCFLQTVLAFLKSKIQPSYEKENNTTDSILYDIYNGVESNPRLGDEFDLKMFQKRLGIMSLSVVNLSFMAAQLKTMGFVTNAMILVNVFLFLYSVDFFYNEVILVNGRNRKLNHRKLDTVGLV
jgi:7-dehydrocholesterol reductase